MSSPTPDWIHHEITSQMPDVPPSLPKYAESWLSPSAFYRMWHDEEKIPTRFCLEIDVIENRKV